MTAEAGLAALWLAAALAALQLVLAWLGVRRDGSDGASAEPAAGVDALLAALRPVAFVQGAMTLIAMAYYRS